MTNIVKEKWVYSGNGIAFDRSSSRNFSNAFARNLVIFAVDNISSPHIDNRKKELSSVR